MATFSAKYVLILALTNVAASGSSSDGSSSSTSSSSSIESASSSSSGSDSQASHGSSSSSGDGSSCASGSGSGGHHQWWTHDYEYDHFQEYCVVALLLVTLLFEVIHHHVEEMARDTWKYGERRNVTHEIEVQHHGYSTLWSALTARASGEFMVLGFLAFAVWCCNQAGVFEQFADGLKDYDASTLPPDGSSYLHAVEDVHMHVFIAMAFYFIVMAGNVYGATKMMQCWSGYSDSLQDAYRSGEIKAGEAEAWMDGKCNRARRFFYFRTGFIKSFAEWRGRWAFWDDHIGVLAEDVDPHTLSQQMEPWFPFAQYLSLNYRAMLDDMIEIKHTTWIGIILIEFLQAQVHSAKANVDFSYIWIAVGVITIAGVKLWCFRKLRGLQKQEYHTVNVKAAFHKFRWGIILVRVLQIALFLTCFELASTIASKYHWQQDVSSKYFIKAVIYTIVFTIGALPSGHIMGHAMARLAAVIATGSFISERNVVRIMVLMEMQRAGKGEDIKQLGDNVDLLDEQVKERRQDEEVNPTARRNVEGI